MPDPASLLPFAFIDAGAIAVMIPIIALMIPIVVILTNHQRKMAELMHRSQSVPANELEGIKQELRDMRMLMNQHTIALDDVRNRQMPVQRDEFQQRIGR